jgi:hypothetical protein
VIADSPLPIFVCRLPIEEAHCLIAPHNGDSSLIFILTLHWEGVKGLPIAG